MTEKNPKMFHIKRVARAHKLSLLKAILHNIKEEEDKKIILNDIKNVLKNKYNYDIELGTLEEYLILLKQLNFIKENKLIEISDLGRLFLSVSEDNLDLKLSEPERLLLVNSLFNLEQFRQFMGFFCDREEVVSVEDFKAKAKPKNVNKAFAEQIAVNWKTFRVIRGWAQQINLIEYNDEKDVFYPIIYEQVDETTFIKFLITEYAKIKGNKYKERISINELRNEICIRYGIRRERFDKLLIDVWNRMPEKICLERVSKTRGKEGIIDRKYGMYYYITLRNLNDRL
ncbi:MAG: hypothetical protein WA130_17520 [Candidatus Methanoperedens sp.]